MEDNYGYNKRQKVLIGYRGTRQVALEDKIRVLAEKHGAAKAGEWGYNEQSYQCMFLFKRHQQLEAFKVEMSRTIDLRVNVVFA